MSVGYPTNTRNYFSSGQAEATDLRARLLNAEAESTHLRGVLRQMELRLQETTEMAEEQLSSAEATLAATKVL